MSVEIKELLGGVTTTTFGEGFRLAAMVSSKLVVAFHEWLQGFLMSKMSFFPPFRDGDDFRLP